MERPQYVVSKLFVRSRAQITMTPAPWKLISSQYLHRRPWLTVRQEHVQLPSGAQIEDYYVFEYPAWVNILAVTTESQFVLIKQYRHALGQVHYELPAGAGDEHDADLVETAKRELREETGYGGGEWSLFMTLSVNAGTHTNLSYTFLAKGVTRLGEANLEPTEDITVHLASGDELKAWALDGSMIQALHVAPILKYLLTAI